MTIDTLGFHGVMVSTLDFESSDPSSNLGRTLHLFFLIKVKRSLFYLAHALKVKLEAQKLNLI